jgi:ABC-type multidrug transport system fused ATPase/permease subunit
VFLKSVLPISLTKSVERIILQKVLSAKLKFMRGEAIFMLQNIKSFIRTTGRILSFAKPFWPVYLVVAVFASLIQFAGLAGPYLNKILLDDVLINKRLELFFLVLAGIFGAYILSQTLGIINNLINAKLSQKQLAHIRLTTFNRLQNLPLDFFHKKNVGDLLTRVSSDSSAIQSFITTIVSAIFINLVNFAATLYISFKLDARLSFLVLGVLPLYIISEKYWVPRITKNAGAILTKNARIFSFLQEALNAVKTIKIFGREQETRGEYEKRIGDYNALDYKNTKIRDASLAINSLILYLPTLLILAFGGFRVLEGALTVGALVALQQYVGRLFGPLSNFVGLNRVIKLQLVQIRRVFEIFDAAPEGQDKPNSLILGKAPGRLEFRNVTFGYNALRPVLQNFSGVIEAGERIGLVGGSGAGKSTLVNLIFRFYEPESGEILLDGINIRNFRLWSLRSRIGVLSQESLIFNTTIEDNILFGKPNAALDEVRQAAKIAGADEFILKLPDGYSTVISERGETLSGGERQRISLARVVLKNPDIIILDEPTSNLDAETEQKVKEALEQVTRGKTTIIIAHRLATVRNIDEIWVLENGQISERGTFDDLVNKKGLFFKYYLAQFGTSKNPRNYDF